MQRVRIDSWLGAGLAALGVLLLLLNLGVFGALAQLIWALLFVAGGMGLLAMVVRNRAHWWALIPGTTLLSLGLLVVLSQFTPALAAAWGGTIVLGGIATGFCAVYLLRPSHWWALIPAGTLLTLAVIAGLGPRLAGPQAGVVLFGGLALTFALVTVAPPGAPRLWALFPAGGLLGLAAVVFTDRPALLSVVGPALLILAGLALLYRAFRRSDAQPDDRPAPPVSQPR